MQGVFLNDHICRDHHTDTIIVQGSNFMRILCFAGILLALLLSSACSDQRAAIVIPGTHEQKTMWDSGSLKERFYTTAIAADSIKQGPYEQWYESGVKAMHGQYKDGLKHGYWHYYDEHGNKSKKVLFQLGEPKRSIISAPYDIQRDTRHPHFHHHPLHHPHW